MQQLPVYQLTPLFEDVQMARIFPDAKTFVDCIPKKETHLLLKDYLEQKNIPGFNLAAFIHSNFELPHLFTKEYHTDQNKSVGEHINELWDILTREPGKENTSLIPLPHAYIVPGGRFGEVYYWDSYFTMLGLKSSGKYEMLENMVANFSHLIKTVGFIPNGNRSYYLGRSQPPFFSLMVKLLATIKGELVLLQYLPSLELEYNYWMKGKEKLNTNTSAVNHLLYLRDDEVLNRYFDAFDTPRPESYREDVELSKHSSQHSPELYRHLRAGAESGWDYSSRWFKDELSFASIHTADIVPVDLNCLLYHLEQTIAEAYISSHDLTNANHFKTLAEKRSRLIQQYCWNNEQQFFVDYDFAAGKQKSALTLAGVAPLYFNIATQPQADAAAEIIQTQFLKAGGLITTLKETGQQWDAPNGWAPLQWMAIVGLENYGHAALAKEIAQRWLQLNTMVYNRTGKMMEKYNVVDPTTEAGGGEYAGQDGFGWTNGVFLALREKRF